MKIFFFHHAGGDQYAFRKIKTELVNTDFEPIFFDYPGHGERFSETLLKDIHSVADDIYAQHKSDFSANFSFFGVSMGTLVSYLIALKLKEDGFTLPQHFFAASRRCPAAHKNYPKSSHLEGDAFWEVIGKYGGCPPALIAHKELREVYEPIIRADFKALEDYDHTEQELLNIPATILYGKDDRFKDGDMDSWQQHFSEPITIQEYEGGHFFCYEQSENIVQLLQQKLK